MNSSIDYNDKSFLWITFILLITLAAIYLNFDLSMNSRPKYFFISSFYLLTWLFAVFSSIKNNYKGMLKFSFVFWISTLITSVAFIISAMGASDIPEFFIIFLFALLTPLKGFAFSYFLLLSPIIFILISLTFIALLMISKIINSKV